MPRKTPPIRYNNSVSICQFINWSDWKTSSKASVLKTQITRTCGCQWETWGRFKEWGVYKDGVYRPVSCHLDASQRDAYIITFMLLCTSHLNVRSPPLPIQPRGLSILALWKAPECHWQWDKFYVGNSPTPGQILAGISPTAGTKHWIW